MFILKQKGDLMAFASGSGLSALDACCACGGGGTQKEALQECPNVVVETKIKKELTETSEFYQEVWEGERYEVIEEEIQKSRIATDQTEVWQNATIVDGNAGQEGSLCAGCKKHYIVQTDGSCEKCEKQETKGAVWVFLAMLFLLIVFKAKQKQTNYRTEAIDRAFADLKASENVEGKPLFPGVFTSSAKQSDIMEQLLRDGKFEGDKMKESLQVSPADVNVWNRLQKPKKNALLQLIAEKTDLKALEERHNAKNLKVVCDKILESANKYDRALAEASFMKKMLPPDKNAEGKKKGNGKETDLDDLYDKYGTSRRELIEYWDRLPGGCDPPAAWYRKDAEGGTGGTGPGTNHLVRYGYALTIDVESTKRLRPPPKDESAPKVNDDQAKEPDENEETLEKRERVDEKLADDVTLDMLAALEVTDPKAQEKMLKKIAEEAAKDPTRTFFSRKGKASDGVKSNILPDATELKDDELMCFENISTDTLYLRYVAAQKWIEENADDIEKAKQYKELDMLPLDELLVRAGDKSLLRKGSELMDIRENAEKDGKKEADSGLLILPDKELQKVARFRMLPFENGVKNMAAAGTGLNYDDLLAKTEDDKKGDASKGGATGGTAMVTALNPLNTPEATPNDAWVPQHPGTRDITAVDRLHCLEQGRFEEWSKDGKKGQQGVDTFVKHLKTRMSSNARFVKGVKSRKDLNERKVRIELGVCERLEMYRRAARNEKMRESDLLRLELQVAETYSQFRTKERKKLAMKASGSNGQQKIAKAKQDAQEKETDLKNWQEQNLAAASDTEKAVYKLDSKTPEKSIESFHDMPEEWKTRKKAYLKALDKQAKAEDELQTGAQAAMEKAEKKAQADADHEQAEIDKKKEHAEKRMRKDAEEEKRQKEAEAEAVAAGLQDIQVDPGGGQASVLTHLQNVYDRHPELDPQKGPKVLVHKAFQFENRSISLQKFKVPFTLPIPEIIPKFSVFMEVVLQSNTMLLAFFILGAIVFHNVWHIGIFEYKLDDGTGGCLRLSSAADSCKLTNGLPTTQDQCADKGNEKALINIWIFAQDDQNMCEWIPDERPLTGDRGGYCRQRDDEQAVCELIDSPNECLMADACVSKRNNYGFDWIEFEEVYMPSIPWYKSDYSRCTDCSILLWVVNPWLRAALTPVTGLLALQLLHMNLNYYLRTYARFLKPLTGRYQEQQQRCDHITHHQSRISRTPAYTSVLHRRGQDGEGCPTLRGCRRHDLRRQC
eukprot:COSAG06_NODE_3870_length_4815_cov_5.357294_1_plen_1237_part_10